MRITVMKKFVLLAGLVLSMGISSLALALSLDEAKSQGLVGERLDGYISAVVADPSADVQALVKTTNDGRRQAYADLAKRNNITIEAVAVVAAEKLRANAGSGEYVQNAGGQWEKK